MPVTDGYTMIQVRESYRDALRELAWQQRKPIYKVLEAIIGEAVDRKQEQEEETDAAISSHS